MRVGGNHSIEDSLERVAFHLSVDENIFVKWKGVQQLLTDSSFAILGIDPEVFSLDIVMASTKKIFDKTESLMPGYKGTNTKLLYNISVGNPIGMPWIQRAEGQTSANNGRRCFIIQVALSQLDRLKNILEYAKMNNLWEPLWGRRLVTVQMVPPQKTGESATHTVRRPAYQKMIRNWGSTKCCTSYMVLPGIIDCTTQFQMVRHNTDGSYKDTVSRSVKQIMESIKWKGYKVFILVAEIWQGIYAAFFSAKTSPVRHKT